MLKILKRLRNYLISGLLFWIPLILTIVVIKFFLEFINNLVPQEYLPEAIFNLDTTIPGSGIILLFIIILITGDIIMIQYIQQWNQYITMACPEYYQLLVTIIKMKDMKSNWAEVWALQR